MRKVISLILLYIFLISNTSFGELLRLPTLIHHYFEHSKMDNLNIIEFLNEHYSNQISHQDDKHHDHENLPFKNVNNQTLQLFSITQHSIYSVNHNFIDKENPPKIIFITPPYSNTYLNSIWQPPRFS